MTLHSLCRSIGRSRTEAMREAMSKEAMGTEPVDRNALNSDGVGIGRSRTEAMREAAMAATAATAIGRSQSPNLELRA